MIRLWDRWTGLWTATEPGTALAWFRIALGAIVLFDQVSVFAFGGVDPLYIPVADGGLAPARSRHLVFSSLPMTELTTWATWGTTVLSAFAVMIGFGGRISALVLLQSMLLFHSLPIDIGGGYDRLLTNGLFLLFVGNCTQTWSVDCWRRTGGWTSEAPVLVLARYLGLLQLTVMYTSTGIVKNGPGWAYPFAAVWRALQREPWSRFGGELPWLVDLYPLTQIGSAIAVWWEATFFVLGLWFLCSFGWFGVRMRNVAHHFDLRWPYLGLGLTMHAVLAVFLNVGTFPTVSVAYYLLARRGYDPTD